MPTMTATHATFKPRKPAQSDTPNAAAINGQPVTLVELVDHEATSYRAWGTPEGDFLARQMERISQLIRFTGAATPEQYEDRIEVLETEAREQWFDVGFAEGRDSCLYRRTMP
jgi:hypothetical protein